MLLAAKKAGSQTAVRRPGGPLESPAERKRASTGPPGESPSEEELELAIKAAGELAKEEERRLKR